jgi:hypothetical protein
MAVTMKNTVFWDIKCSSYLTGNTIRLRYRTQPPVNAKLSCFHGGVNEKCRLLVLRSLLRLLVTANLIPT